MTLVWNGGSEDEQRDMPRYNHPRHAEQPCKLNLSSLHPVEPGIVQCHLSGKTQRQLNKMSTNGSKEICFNRLLSDHTLQSVQMGIVEIIHLKRHMMIMHIEENLDEFNQRNICCYNHLKTETGFPTQCKLHNCDNGMSSCRSSELADDNTC